MSANKGYLCLMLHAHLPFVRHPEHKESLEERWLYEAITETYIPLIAMMERLVDEGVHFRLTMSITPPLANMLKDHLLQQRYLQHLEKLQELAEKEVHRTRQHEPHFHDAALMYRERFGHARKVFAEHYHCDLVEAFKRFQDCGVLEIVTCSATHGFLPLYQDFPNAVRAQVAVGAQSYAHHFGRPARGTWNAECAYFPGLDRHLHDEGINFFFTDTHAILFAEHRPVFGVYAPLYTHSGVAAFGRDHESSKSVWSAEEGYPGDFNYREFYRDIGYDREDEYIAPYIHESGLRIATGMKYQRITGRPCELHHKAPYNPVVAHELVHSHAGNFLHNRERQVEYLNGLMDRPPVIVAPYDAELFGHWWYEGPYWIESLLRKIHYDTDVVETITPSEYLARHPINQVANPSMSSWGANGYAEVWLMDNNDWTYRHLHQASERMIDLANRFRHESDPGRVRMLNQAARELLLAQSSDWPFIMKTNTMVEYAIKRVEDHLLAFRDLWRMLNDYSFNEEYLADLESRNNIFPFLDFRVYADR